MKAEEVMEDGAAGFDGDGDFVVEFEVNVAAEDEQLEEQVESSQELSRTREQRDQDEHARQESPSGDNDSDPAEDHIDLQA